MARSRNPYLRHPRNWEVVVVRYKHGPRHGPRLAVDTEAIAATGNGSCLPGRKRRHTAINKRNAPSNLVSAIAEPSQIDTRRAAPSEHRLPQANRPPTNSLPDDSTRLGCRYRSTARRSKSGSLRGYRIPQPEPAAGSWTALTPCIFFIVSSTSFWSIRPGVPSMRVCTACRSMVRVRDMYQRNARDTIFANDDR